MPIIKADLLRAGDVLLETGEPKIANSTALGAYGHASLAVTRLMWLQVGPRGVQLEARPINRYRVGDELFIGFEVAGEALVRRRHAPPTATDVWTEVTSELGRKYASRVKLQRIEDLTPEAVEALAEPLPLVPEADDPLTPGRTCSEASAVVLGLSKTLISPNALALTDELIDLPALVISNAALIEPEPRAPDLADRVNAIGRRAGPKLSKAMQDCAARLKAGEDVDQAAFAAAIEAEFITALKANSKVVREIEALEAQILDG